MFSVGDIVRYGPKEYTVTEVLTNGADIRVTSRSSNRDCGSNPSSIFTLVTPAGPPPSVLTGMTQFFKDKEKNNEASI